MTGWERACTSGSTDHSTLGCGQIDARSKPIKSKSWTKGEEIAVIASMIRLGNCFDLLDEENVRFLKEQHLAYVAAQNRLGEPLPQNVRTHRYLDRAVFEFTYAVAESAGVSRTVDTCRAVYVPTDKKERVWEGSWISHGTHIQICVRNPRCILGTWLVTAKEESSPLESELIDTPFASE